MIKLDAVACSFNKQNILKDISLEINSHLSILGANGSGKSTLAKAICGLLEYKGSIFIDEVNIQDLALIEKAKNISYIPAKLDIYDSYITVEEFVLQGRFPHKTSIFEYSHKDKQITKETLDFLKISHLKEHTVSSLSSGEQQLILIAQALTQQSKIIIFDEPTANLDPHNAKVIAQHIKGLQKYHQVILITHDLHLAAYMQSPILFIKDSHATHYTQEFFDDSTLSELYNVTFKDLVASYD